MIIESWDAPKTLYIQYLGKVTGRELIDHALVQSGDSRFDDLLYVISDWTYVRETDVSPQDIQELVACLIPISKQCPRARNASVIRANETAPALTAWYRHLGDHISWEIDIFHNTEEAFQHYNIDATAITQYEQSPCGAVHYVDAPIGTRLAMSPTQDAPRSPE